MLNSQPPELDFMSLKTADHFRAFHSLVHSKSRFLSPPRTIVAFPGPPLVGPGKAPVTLAVLDGVFPRAAKVPVASLQANGSVAVLAQGDQLSWRPCVKKNIPKVGDFRAFATAKRTIVGFEAMLWLKKGFGFAGEWTVRRQNELIALCFDFKWLIIPEDWAFSGFFSTFHKDCESPTGTSKTCGLCLCRCRRKTEMALGAQS